MTIREHLEAIRDAWERNENYDCGFDASTIGENVVAALAILEAAAFGFDIDHGWREDRLIPDPGKNPELAEDSW